MNPPLVLPPAARAVLTRPLACAALMVLMLMSAAWLPWLFGGMPLLGALATMIGVSLHVLSPGLIALVSFGGGAGFGLKVAALASLGVGAAAGFELLPGLIVLLLYGLLPAYAALRMSGQDGMSRSARTLAIALGSAALGGLLLAGAMQDRPVSELIAQWIAPMFVAPPGAEPALVEAVNRARHFSALILPGMLAFALWMVWWGDVALARRLAERYGFYQGQPGSALELRFGKGWVIAFMLALAGANFGSGEAQYLAINAAIMLGGLIAAQGVAVVHAGLKARGMQMAVALMYLMLLMWSAMIIPFVIVGLLDTWFDYRRNMPATGGQ